MLFSSPELPSGGSVPDRSIVTGGLVVLDPDLVGKTVSTCDSDNSCHSAPEKF